MTVYSTCVRAITHAREALPLSTDSGILKTCEKHFFLYRMFWRTSKVLKYLIVTGLTPFTSCLKLLALAGLDIRRFATLPNIASALAIFCLMKKFKLFSKLAKFVVATAEHVFPIELYRFVISKLLSKSAKLYRLPTEILRSKFTTMEFARHTPVVNHTHAKAAADRSSGTLFCERFSKAVNHVAYFFQRSKSDQRSGRSGSRSFYWMKDVDTEPVMFNTNHKSLICMIDVDYHVPDLSAMLCRHFRPYLLYTFQPERVCKDRGESKDQGEYSYTFNERNEVIYKVSGGAEYKHKVWNWSTDHLMVTQYYLGFPVSVSTYLVDRRRTSPDHELVLLTPVKQWNWLNSLLPFIFMDGHKLSRIEPVQGNFLVLNSEKKDTSYVSVGKVNTLKCAYLPTADNDSIASIAKTTKYKISVSQIVRFVDQDIGAASILLEYHRTFTEPIKAPVVFPLEESIYRYQYTQSGYDVDAKPGLTPFMSPLYLGAFAPDMTKENEIAGIRGRITKVKPKVLTMSPFLARVINEYVNYFIPKPGMLEPVDYEELLTRQPRPSQRRILANAEYEVAKRVLSTFNKKEAYGGVKPPRIISTVNGVDKANYSQFMYAVADHMKSMGWYAFGKSSQDVARRVTKVLENASFAVNSDFSRFDGRVSNILRDIEQLILVRAFRSKYTEQIIDLHSSQFNVKAYGKLGTKYDQGFARASGSPETAVFNSVANSFVAYLAFRMTKVGIQGKYLLPDQAWSSLGIYGGDDGLTADIDVRVYAAAASLVGQKLTLEPIQRGKMGITFLARIYGPDVWYGDPNSCCDIPRQLSKIHTTVNLPPDITPEMKLLEKARAYLLTDNNTPIIGPYFQKVIEVHGCCEDYTDNPRIQPMIKWGSLEPFLNQYPNYDSGWMLGYVQSAMPDFDLASFEEHLKTCDTLHSLMNFPSFTPPKKITADEAVTVNGYPYGNERKSRPRDKTRARNKGNRPKRFRSKQKPRQRGPKLAEKPPVKHDKDHVSRLKVLK